MDRGTELAWSLPQQVGDGTLATSRGRGVPSGPTSPAGIVCKKSLIMLSGKDRWCRSPSRKPANICASVAIMVSAIRTSCWEVCAALTHGEPDTGFVEPLAAPTMTNPLVSSLFDVAKSTPRLFVRDAVRLWKLAWSVFRRHVVAFVNRTRVVPSRRAGDQDERYVAVWSKSDPEFIEEVRRYRDSEHPSASVRAVLMWSICRALQECGALLSL